MCGVKLEVKTLELPKCKVSKTGLVFDESLTYDEWELIGKQLQNIHKSIQFWIGDWLNFGERKFGEMYAQAIEETGLDYQTLANYKTVANLVEFTRRRVNLSWSCHREVAFLNPEIQENLLEKGLQEGWHTRDFTRAGKIVLREQKIDEFKKLSKGYDNKDIQIFNEDFRSYAKKIDDNSIDLILTDPPYPKEFLPLWEDMFEIADRILKPSAFLVTYSGQMYLDKIFKMKNNLIYYWTANIIFTKKPLILGRNIINEWKPILIFQKTPFKQISDTISDTISFNYSERDMHDKNWGQTIAPFEFLLDKFSKPNDLIFEPFAGTGTTLIACQRKKRKCIGTEIDKQYIDLIKGRLLNER